MGNKINKQEETNENTKMELYPDRKPRYDFKKYSLSRIVPKDALSFSFDKDKELGFISNNVPILQGFYTAHTNHYPIRIKPDDIWLLIVHAFSHHVNINSESLRNMFVNFNGKKQLIVKYPLSSISQVNKNILEDFSEQINNQMKQYLGEKLLDILTPNYSTTDYDSSIVCKISIMGAFKKFFDYTMDLSGCGIPYIILEGTADDYEKIKSKAQYLSKYKFSWYIKRIIPHINKMIKAKKGNVDTNYFKNIIQNKEKTEYKPGLSGMGGSDVKVDYISGWFLDFFAYWGSEDNYIPFKEKDIKVENFFKFPRQMLTVPFNILDEDNNHEMKYTVGFIGCDQNEKYEVSPITGWIVSPSTKEDIESIL